MIAPERYRTAWLDPRATENQSAGVVKDLSAWLDGEAHVAFDAFRDVLAPVLNELGSICEAGCGVGVYSAVIQQILPRVQYVGVDVAPNQIEKAREMFPAACFIEASADNLPFTDGAFDIVDLAAVIQHLPDYHKAIQEAVRVSRRYVLLHRLELTVGETREWLNPAYGVELPTREINADELANFCTSCGLLNIGEKRWGGERQWNASWLFEKGARQ